MKITRLLLAMMAVAVLFASCKKDDDDDEEVVPAMKRLVKVETVGDSYSQTDVYTYNDEGYVATHEYTYNSESSNNEKTTTYTHNENGEPIEWTQTGTGYGNGTTTANISSNKVIITKPSGSETEYTLNSNDRFTYVEDGYWSYDYFWSGNNLLRKEGPLSEKYAHDLTKDNVMPALGAKYWERSENLITKAWIYNYDDQSDMSLFVEYTFDFNADGTPATATMYNGFYSDDTFSVTYTYEEY
jgi:hypothetical protein